MGLCDCFFNLDSLEVIMSLLTRRQRQSALLILIKVVGVILISPILLVIAPFVIYFQWQQQHSHVKKPA